MPEERKRRKKSKDRKRSRSYHSRSRSRSRSQNRDRHRSRQRDRRFRSSSRSRSRSPYDDDEPKRKQSKLLNSIDSFGNGTKAAISASSSNPLVSIEAPKASELFKDILSKNDVGNGGLSSSQSPLSGLTSDAASRAARAIEIQNQIASQLASVSSLLRGAQAKANERKAAYRPLLLDSQGREIDEKGNLVKLEDQIKTLAANVAVNQAKKRVENPYLAHRTPAAPTAVPGTESASPPPSNNFSLPVLDDRLKTVKRAGRAKRAFNFVEAGTYAKQADKERLKEERKIIAGYSSGRRAPQITDEGGDEEGVTAPGPDGEGSGNEGGAAPAVIQVPKPCDEGIVPVMEWWDEALLPKATREERKRSRAAQEEDHSSLRSLQHCKTYKYVQHPLPVKPLGGERADEPMPVFLTKKERKRVRRTAREAREREKRDKMLMGLLPPAEPKFKLSNFMKVLGEQAVADPSKVEMRVVQQMQQRQMNHEMRNQARQLTPAEWKDKKRRKLHEDTSRQVHVAVFRVKDFSSLKHRFKVDVNAQQYNLTGVVLICTAVSTNLVVVEGGPKGIKRFIKLILRRIHWDADIEAADTAEHGLEDDDEVGSDNEGPGGEDTHTGEGSSSTTSNRCDLLWEGVVPKRTFHGFRFQECRTAASARKVLEAKGAAHYWDMAARADTLLEM